MKLFRVAFLSFACMWMTTAVAAQDAKQQLNEQLWEAARKGDATQVAALLDKGADVNAKFRYGTTALFKASERGNTEVVRLLLARGADVTVKDTFYGATAMTWALDHDHLDVVKALLEKDKDSVGDVLVQGARENKPALVEIALARGGVDAATMTLALASAMADPDTAAIAEMLRKAGAQPPLEVDAATLTSYAGNYKSEQGNEFLFEVREGKFFVVPKGQQPIALMALDKTTFKPVAFDSLKVAFTVSDGKVTAMTLTQRGTPVAYKRVE